MNIYYTLILIAAMLVSCGNKNQHCNSETVHVEDTVARVDTQSDESQPTHPVISESDKNGKNCYRSHHGYSLQIPEGWERMTVSYITDFDLKLVIEKEVQSSSRLLKMHLRPGRICMNFLNNLQKWKLKQCLAKTSQIPN